MKLLYRFRRRLLPMRGDADKNPVVEIYPNKASLFRGAWKEYRWMIIMVLAALIMVLTSVLSFAQPPKPGDRVPDLQLGAGGPRLSAFKGQVVILDFWATWCAPCVMMIPRMDSLQKEYAGKVRFVSVAYQPESEVRGFMQKLEAQRGRRFDLTEVYGDTSLRKVFKPGSYPHYVWIGLDGRVAAVTSFSEVTRENLNRLLDRRTVATTVREDTVLPYDYHQPMIVRGNGGDGSNLLYHSFLTSYTPGLHPGLAIVVDSVTGKKITCKNNSLHWLYELAYSDSGRNFNRQNTRYLVKDTTRFTNRKSVGQAYLDWLAEGNGFCYELQVPKSLVPAALKMMRQDLDRYFTQYKASVVKETRQCLILSRTGSSKIPGNAGAASDVRLDPFAWTVSNCTLGILCERLNYNQVLPYPVVDETGIAYPVDLQLPVRKVNAAGRPDIDGINQELAAYGLQLKQGIRTREILVIQDREP